MPRFSVIITVFNKADYITDTLNSVLLQTVTDFEIIIYNDGSTDASKQKILAFKDTRIHYFEGKNIGAAAARNLAIKKSNSNYIALLDADDLWKPNYLEEINTLILKYPDHHIYATALYKEDRHSVRKANYSFDIIANQHLSLNYFKASLKNSILHSSSTVIKNTLINTYHQPFDPTIKSGQDTDLWVRLGLNNPIAFSTNYLATHKYRPNSLYKKSTSTLDRPQWNTYKKEELRRPEVKKFIDLNRFSEAIKAKLWGEHYAYIRFRESINPSNLNWKQRTLLKLPVTILKLLTTFKAALEKTGIKMGVFS